MKQLAKNIYFWVFTAIFVGLMLAAIIFLIPPLTAQLKDNRAKITDLDTKIKDNEQFLVTLQGFEKKTGELNLAFNQTNLLLPKTPQPEILILQLAGLLDALSLANTSIEVPLSATSKTADASAVTSFTLNGAMSYEQTKQLISGLRALDRWNKLRVVTIGLEGGSMKATITGEAFAKSGEPKLFTGDADLLTRATKLLDSLNSYTTVPDVSTEGSFGKKNPFN